MSISLTVYPKPDFSQKYPVCPQAFSNTWFSRTLKPWELHFTPEQEVQLAQIATKAGTDPSVW
jgi:hypothetical protein